MRVSLSNVGAVLSSLQSAMRQALLVIAYVRMPSSDEIPHNDQNATPGRATEASRHSMQTVGQRPTHSPFVALTLPILRLAPPFVALMLLYLRLGNRLSLP